MGHEGHESHEQHAFTSPYPSGVAGLVKKRGILAGPEHPFSLLLETLHCPTLRRNTVEASLLVLLFLAVINNGMAPVLRLFIRTRVVLKVSLPYAPRAEFVEEHITTAVCVHFSKQLLGLLAR